MKKLTALVAVVLFLFTATPAAAQFGFGAHAGVSIPAGDYGDTGAAELGFLGGLDLWLPIMMVPGLSWYTSADAIAHSTDETINTDFVNDAGYLYFPLMTGVRFDLPLGPVGLFATGQVGAVFAKAPSADFGAGEVGGDLTTELGFALGAGVQATDYIYGGVKFYPMGDVEWTWDAQSLTQQASFIDIYVGFGVR